MQTTRDVVFIHGMYLNGTSWQPWVDMFTQRGYRCHAPSWPMHDGDPAALRRTIDPALGKLTFGQVTSFLKAVTDPMPEPPVLVGHSIGGLQVQKLINDGYGVAGVAISPAPPRGVFSYDPHFYRANFPHANPLAGDRPVIMTPKRFHYTFCNTMSRAASDTAFTQYVVPESRNVPRSTLTKQGQIDFRKPHAPLLMIAAERDHLTPASLIRRNANAYRVVDSAVDFTEFPGRSHFICNQDGWQEVAEYALGWMDRQGLSP
jgi:pimeloyl-ACP methyl ester carboxylesterase